MPSVTTQELVDRARAASDMRDNFVTPTQWMYWASQERLSLDLFLARSGWMLATTSQDLTITGAEAGIFNINPSSGVMAIVSVHEYNSQGTRLVQYKDAINFLRQLPGNSTNPKGHAIFYRAQWSGDAITLNFYPEPNIAETYRVTYIAQPNRLALSAASGYDTSVTYPMGWEERVVLGMARRALIKEESDTQQIDSEIALWDARISEACWNRILGESPTIRNIDEATRTWMDRRIFPPVSHWAWL